MQLLGTIYFRHWSSAEELLLVIVSISLLQFPWKLLPNTLAWAYSKLAKSFKGREEDRLVES